MASILSPILSALSWLLCLPWKLVHLASGFLHALKKNLSDPYFVDFHSELNATSGEHHQSQTEWINMGYWKETNDFPTACKALALKLVQVAQCKSDGIVLDVGHGCGDSLLLHLEHPSIPRPKRLVGITSQIQHYRRALERTSVRNPGDSVDMCLTHGDAVYRGDTPSHPLDAKTYEGAYTTILALDCAYHFRSRRLFLEQSFKCLAIGGNIALGDICFAPGSLSLTTRFMIALMGSMPSENVMTTEEYVAMLRGIGYVDVKLENITQDVFPGFVTFLKGRGLAFGILASHFERLVSRGMLFVIVSASKP
ncbi:hypothetical protein BDY19DRAFT_913950 [Irpex rosettiformis]|uniref:Uncharacterized protein n=1 Tax=Irpex rosettiformis TaxID=378272 RepID=A0ACB8UK01_9APHY|nr:hypothetical protein BDY19DRAFT_913950 [Irpex rosettiformis]